MCEELVHLIPNVLTMKPVRTTTVLIHVQHLVAKELTVVLKTMLLFADAQEAIQEIHSKDVEDLLRTRSVKLVVPIQSVK